MKLVIFKTTVGAKGRIGGYSGYHSKIEDPDVHFICNKFRSTSTCTN